MSSLTPPRVSQGFATHEESDDLTLDSIATPSPERVPRRPSQRVCRDRGCICRTLHDICLTNGLATFKFFLSVHLPAVVHEPFRLHQEAQLSILRVIRRSTRRRLRRRLALLSCHPPPASAPSHILFGTVVPLATQRACYMYLRRKTVPSLLRSCRILMERSNHSTLNLDAQMEIWDLGRTLDYLEELW